MRGVYWLIGMTSYLFVDRCENDIPGLGGALERGIVEDRTPNLGAFKGREPRTSEAFEQKMAHPR